MTELRIPTERSGVTLELLSSLRHFEDYLKCLKSTDADYLAPYSRRAQHTFINPQHALEIHSSPDYDGPQRFGIYDGPVFTGQIDLMTYPEDDEAYIGLWLGEAYTGIGYATIAAVAMYGYVTETLGLDRVRANVAHYNNPSKRVMERAGFRLTGLGDPYWTYTR